MNEIREIAESIANYGLDRRAVLVARAYLADQDDEPITFAWLRPMATSKSMHGFDFDGPNNSIHVYKANHGGMCALVNKSPYMHAVRLGTRGEMRLLCRALNIPLDEKRTASE